MNGESSPGVYSSILTHFDFQDSGNLPTSLAIVTTDGTNQIIDQLWLRSSAFDDLDISVNFSEALKSVVDYAVSLQKKPKNSDEVSHEEMINVGKSIISTIRRVLSLTKFKNIIVDNPEKPYVFVYDPDREDRPSAWDS